MNALGKMNNPIGSSLFYGHIRRGKMAVGVG